MRPFTYARAADLSSAIAEASADGTSLLAGGTELLNWMKEGIAAPTRVVDINALSELDYIELGATELRIGALARMSAVAAHPDVEREFPALRVALEKSASQQIRNMASMGGNLLQRTRCPYFRAEVELPCNKRVPGSGCAALGGEDRSLAVLAGSERCIATHPSDAAVALAMFDAVVRIHGPSGAREVPIRELYVLPGATPHVETVLAPGDVIVEIALPRSRMTSSSHYLKVRERASYEFALVSAAAGVESDGRIIRAAKIALGGVAPKPWRLMSAEANLVGVSLDDEAAMRRALARDFDAARPGRQNGFKIELAKRTAIRALQVAGGVA
ncbi:MAG TPA: xanthine dehydrogenase family protein subunit M [Gammaproteobacteria bacterium]